MKRMEARIRQTNMDFYKSGINGFGGYIGREREPSYQTHYDRFKKLLTIRHPTPKILEVGIGSSTYYQYSTDNALTIGTDINLEALKLHKQHLIQLTLSDANELAFKSESFEGIHSKDMLVHIPNKDKFLKEIHRVLKPRSILLITSTTCKRSEQFVSKINQDKGRYFTLKEEKFTKALEKNNFEILQNQDWIPESTEADWYSKYPRRRFVIIAQKI